MPDPTDEELLQIARGGSATATAERPRLTDDEIASDPRFNTKLTPQEEAQFQSWKAKYAPQDSGYDYDLRGAFKDGFAPNENGHWPDRHKKPNHETYSDESRFATMPDFPAKGSWNGTETFTRRATSTPKVAPPRAATATAEPSDEELLALARAPSAEGTYREKNRLAAEKLKAQYADPKNRVAVDPHEGEGPVAQGARRQGSGFEARFLRSGDRMAASMDEGGRAASRMLDAPRSGDLGADVARFGTDALGVGGALWAPVQHAIDTIVPTREDVAQADPFTRGVAELARMPVQGPVDVAHGLMQVPGVEPLARAAMGEQGPQFVEGLGTLLLGGAALHGTGRVLGGPGLPAAVDAAGRPLPIADPRQFATGELGTRELPYTPQALAPPAGLFDEIAARQAPIPERANPYTQIDPNAGPAPVAGSLGQNPYTQIDQTPAVANRRFPESAPVDQRPNPYTAVDPFAQDPTPGRRTVESRTGVPEARPTTGGVPVREAMDFPLTAEERALQSSEMQQFRQQHGLAPDPAMDALSTAAHGPEGPRVVQQVTDALARQPEAKAPAGKLPPYRTWLEQKAGQPWNEISHDSPTAKAWAEEYGKLRDAGKPVRSSGRGMKRRGGSQSGELRIPTADEVREAGARAKEVAGAIAKKSGEIGQQLIGRSVREHDAMGQGGKGREMRHGVQAVTSRTRADVGSEMTKLKDAEAAFYEKKDTVGEAIGFTGRKALSDAYHRLPEMVEGRSAPKNAAEMGLVNAARSLFRRVATKANELGVRIEDAAAEGGNRLISTDWEQFWPQILKPDVKEAIRAGKKDFAADLRRANPSMTEAEAGEALQRLRAPRVESHHPGTELPRKFTYPKEWLETDGRKVLEMYAEDALQNAHEHDVFKLRRDVPQADGSVKSVRDQGRYGDLLSRIGDDSATTISQALLGRDKRGNGSIERAAIKVGRWEGMATSARLLGGVTENFAQQITQPVNTLMGGSVKSLARGAQSFARNPKAALRRAIESGAVQPDAFMHHMGFDKGLEARGARFVNAATKPLQLHDMFWRVIQNEAAPHMIREWQADLRSGGKKAARRAAMLDDLDLSTDQVARLRDGKVTVNDTNFIKQRIQSAFQIEGGMENVPYLMSHPVAKPLLRLKTFTMGQARSHVNFAIKPLLRGDYKPMVRLIGAGLVAGELITATNRTVFGPKKDVPEWDEIMAASGSTRNHLIAKRLLADAKAASVFGILGDAVTSTAEGHLGSFVERQTTPPAVNLMEKSGQGIDRELAGKGDGVWKSMGKYILDNIVGIKSAMHAIQVHTASGRRAEIERHTTEAGEDESGFERQNARLRRRAR